MMSDGVFKAFISGCSASRLETVTTNAMMPESRYVRATAFLSELSSFAPKCLAITTAKPFVSPPENPMSRPYTGVEAPTAASDLSPRMLPIIAVSAIL